MASATRKRRSPRAGPATVQALERGLGILNAVADGRGRPLAEIAQIVDLNLSTAHHLVKTLEAAGYVVQGSDRGWRVGGRAFQLAAAAWNADDLAEFGAATVRELCRKTGEAGQLAILERRDVLVVCNIDGAGPERLFGRLGEPRPAYSTALGKALLAYQSEPAVDEYLAATKLVRFTPKTVKSGTRLREQLREARRAGYAVDNEEFSQGIRCIAAPVFNFTGGVVAALGMYGAAWRISPARVAGRAAQVMQFAESLSRELGYSDPYPPPVKS